MSDKIGSKQAAAISGIISGLALTLIPVGLLQNNHIGSESFVSIIGGPDATIFSLLVIVWAIAVAAQGPALTSLSQQNGKLALIAFLFYPAAFCTHCTFTHDSSSGRRSNCFRTTTCIR